MTILDYQTTIDAAEDYLLTLCDSIYSAKDFAKVEQKISDASKVRLGLKALNLTEDELSAQSKEQIIVGLNALCNVYSQQTIPQINI